MRTFASWLQSVGEQEKAVSQESCLGATTRLLMVLGPTGSCSHEQHETRQAGTTRQTLPDQQWGCHILLQALVCILCVVLQSNELQRLYVHTLLPARIVQ